mmetsp:Transcript_28253/g.59673  ORF Transcript_28253/g.59673 Transcript_28253/m.59673 type:complete len:139 (-) Transcript_28253:45-461(-)
MDVFSPIIFKDTILRPSVVFASDGIFIVGAGGTVEDKFHGSGSNNGGSGSGGGDRILHCFFDQGGFEAHGERRGGTAFVAKGDSAVSARLCECMARRCQEDTARNYGRGGGCNDSHGGICCVEIWTGCNTTNLTLIQQ